MKRNQAKVCEQNQDNHVELIPSKTDANIFTVKTQREGKYHSIQIYVFSEEDIELINAMPDITKYQTAEHSF